MKKSLILSFFGIFCFLNSYAQHVRTDIQDIERILNTLAGDDMLGRPATKPDVIGKAADFIASEFEKIGLATYTDEEKYRQTFSVVRIQPNFQKVILENQELDSDKFLIYGKIKEIQWTNRSSIKKSKIQAKDDFSMHFREIIQGSEDELVLVDKSHANMLARFKGMIGGTDVVNKDQADITSPAKVFIIADHLPSEFDIHVKNSYEEIPMFNVIGVIPGKSKPNEYVIFSAHYDHLGILDAVGQDSIANGADDDASGVTAVISLAKYYKELGQNERTLLFVAFTGEELGMFGSRYFSNNINADEVIAMINIEMIGKDAKFGPNSVFITGFEASNLGKLMQEKVEGTGFSFHPDPYIKQNLFYRSDNAVLASLGVPAHSFSTCQIDQDEYYHTVKDEVSTLDVKNIQSTIEAIATGAVGIVNGLQTPTRVEKLRQ